VNPTLKLVLLIAGIIATVVAGIVGFAEYDGGTAWMFLLGWCGIGALGASTLP
jgi:hypothetical protein